MECGFSSPLSPSLSYFQGGIYAHTNALFVVPSRATSQNLHHLLWDREHGYNRRNLRHQLAPWYLEYEREFYKCITPNFSVLDIDNDMGHLRKFTPDGQLLMSFSRNRCFVDVYKYMGYETLLHLLYEEEKEYLSTIRDDYQAEVIRASSHIEVLDRLWHIELVPPDSEALLEREFSVFVDGSNFVLVCSFESLSTWDPNGPPDKSGECQLFTFEFFLINLHNGEISDTLTYDCDCIPLRHNKGVSVQERTILLLSKYRHCIDLVHVTVYGDFSKMYCIGPYGLQLRQPLSVERTEPYLRDRIAASKLAQRYYKQRIFTFLYRKILVSTAVHEDSGEALVEAAKKLRREKLKEFYRNFEILECMDMCCLQFIAERNIILVRYEQKPYTLERLPYAAKYNVPDQMYVFYNISSDEILNIYMKDSVELMYLFRDFCDTFCNVRSLDTNRPPSSLSNDAYVRSAFNRDVDNFRGGKTEAAKRFNPFLPISSQSFTTNPYLDSSLFQYDTFAISTLERPRRNTFEPIRFCDRITGYTKFRLYMKTFPADKPAAGRRKRSTRLDLVSFICHPFDPFIISLQTSREEYRLNFHLYNPVTVVNPWSFSL